MRASIPLLSIFTTLTFLTAGCATVLSTSERPESLEPVAVDASPQRAYDEALALAFDQGYHIAYSSEEERLIELDVLDRRPLLLDRVRRIDLFVRTNEGRTYIHARYHSFDAGNPNDIQVREGDREATQRFVETLVKQIESSHAPRPKRDAGEDDAL